MKILRWLFFPISLLYAGIMMCRNWAFDKKWFSVYRSTIPTISVGNLNTGGTGKTPFVEFLIEKLKAEFQLATLSRGYGRKTKGFLRASEKDNAQSLGDEPYQMQLKYGKQVLVSVDEKRANGLQELEKLKDTPDLVIMDDAYQHRYAERDLNILLTSYDDLFVDDFVLPTGNLRESRVGARRSDMIVVTKCSSDLSASQKNNVIRRLSKYCTKEQIYFSSIKYGRFKNLQHESVELESNNLAVLTGIANPQPFLNHLDRYQIVEHFKFRDHHSFTKADLDAISVKLSQKDVPLVTTEKDMVRLLSLADHSLFKEREVLYLPIAVQIDREEDFLNRVMTSLKRAKS